MDGILRRVPGSFPGQDGRTRDSWALRAVRTLLAPRDPPNLAANAFLVDWTADWKAISRVSWKDLPAAFGEKPAWFRNRLVLLGAEFAGSGEALLAEMDRRLALLKEAQQEFQAALKKAPEDPALRQALQRLEAQLADDVE